MSEEDEEGEVIARDYVELQQRIFTPAEVDRSSVFHQRVYRDIALSNLSERDQLRICLDNSIIFDCLRWSEKKDDLYSLANVFDAEKQTFVNARRSGKDGFERRMLTTQTHELKKYAPKTEKASGFFGFGGAKKEEEY